ncbi:sugar nucleotide-binding protein [Alphaproteobacteria bacterium]|nr:sugar nucleotide-binding protein [Alphaproteobacteria bacterium]
MKFHNYDVFILCSSITSIKFCESKPVLSKKINVEGLKYIIKKILPTKKKIIFLSSSVVFNGNKEFYKEHDYRKPINNYGKYKKEIEDYIKKYSKNYAILRLSKVDTALLPLIKEWVNKLNHNRSINPFSSSYISPVPIKSVLFSLILLMKNKYNGTFHLSGKDEINYLKVAEIILRYFKLDSNLIITESGKLHKRKFTTMKTSKFLNNVENFKSDVVIENLISQYL